MSWRYLLLAALCLGNQACSVLKANPAPAAGFLPKPELLSEMKERFPFHGAWIFDKDEYTKLKAAYDKIVILPVDITIAEKAIKNKKLEDVYKQDRLEEAQEVGRYMRNAFIGALNEYEEHPLQVVVGE